MDKELSARCFGCMMTYGAYRDASKTEIKNN